MAGQASPRTFQLSPEEEKIFNFLREVQSNFFPDVVLRVAGGWVRDRLLNLQNKDIDITLNIPATPFAEKIRSYLIEKGHGERTLSLVPANHEAGRHLDVATIKVFEVSLDFVSLRAMNHTQEGVQDSIGTPEEDALQRDLTINALFYNVNNDTIEDWTGTSISDLQNGIIRTPLPASKTFTDDPLRVMRALRFAARYNFKPHDEMIEGIRSCPQIIQQLHANTARERIGSELRGILSHKHFFQPILLMGSLGLFPSVFLFPPQGPEMPSDFLQKSLATFTLASNLIDLISINELLPCELHVFLLASLVLPVFSMQYKVRQKQLFVVQYITTEALKALNKTSANVLCFNDHQNQWKEVIRLPDFGDRVTRGLAVRNSKELWPAAILLALVDLCNTGVPVHEAVPVFNNLVQKIKGEGLDGVWNMKPLKNGEELMKLLPITGKEVGKALDASIRWQLTNPRGETQELEAYLLTKPWLQ